MPRNRLTLLESLHHKGYARGLLGCGQQVYMTGHQDIGEYVAVISSGCLQQQIQVKPAVRRREETGMPVVATLNDVLGISRESEARLPYHVGC